MSTLLKICLLCTMLVGLTACGGGTNSTDTYYEPVPDYKLFPVGYFTPGYHQDYHLTGYDTLGRNYTGNYHVVSNTSTYFDGEYNIPVTFTTSLTSDFGSSETKSITQFYSNQNYRLYQNGSENLITGEVSFAEHLDQIPAFAYIGDSGRVGSYIMSSGKSVIKNWQINDAGFGAAKLVFISSTYDVYDHLETLYEKTLEINQYGDIYSLKIVHYNAGNGVYTYLEGTPE